MKKQNKNSDEGPSINNTLNESDNVIIEKKKIFVNNQKTPVWANKTIVGNIYGRTYLKRVFASKHFLHFPPAISLNLSEIMQMEHLGAINIVIFDKEEKLYYFSPLSYFKSYSIDTERGWGKQKYLPLTYWQICDDINSFTLK